MSEYINLMIFSESAATKMSLKLTDMIGSPRGAETKPKSGFSYSGNYSYSSLLSFHEKSKLFICVPRVLLFREFREQHPYSSSGVVDSYFQGSFLSDNTCRHIHMCIGTHTLIKSLATWWFIYSAELFEFVSNI